MKYNPALNQVQALTSLKERNGALASDSKAKHAARFQPLIGELIPKMQGIANKLSRPDRTRTDAANFLDLTHAVKVTADAAFASLKAGQRVRDEILSDIVQKEDARLGFKKGNQDRTAIIAKFSALNQADQMTQIGVWMRDGQRGGVMIGIVSEADTFLTGLSSDMVARLRSDFVKAHAPDLADERDEVTQAFEVVMAAQQAVQLVTDEVKDERRYNEIIRDKAQADADNAVFAGTT